jgi:acetylornithine deacetylase/succinyl-diaminopimelate desuccinylase-like protein
MNANTNHLDINETSPYTKKKGATILDSRECSSSKSYKPNELAAR